ncbi:defensin-like protein 1 [Cornus florida]|uniref:defensin-like protein 1 n=1 Tax=Cornus florida TaxID=4283 RepID=UPI00289FE6A9|nr:defensin-like protein 1 [Cornus florida]
MARINAYSKLFLAVLFCFLLASAEIVAAKKLCERKSKTWSGACIMSKNCKKECKKKDHAETGECHSVNIFNRQCFCHFKC